METHLGSILAAGVDASVRDAMGWDEEDRGVVTAADVDQLLPPPPQSATAAATAAGKSILYPSVAGTSSAADGNDEEILLDYDEEEEEEVGGPARGFGSEAGTCHATFCCRSGECEVRPGLG